MRLFIDGAEYTYEEGTTFLQVASLVQADTEDTIALAVYGNKLYELFKVIPGDGEIRFLTVKDKNGKKAYRRSVTFLMQAALKRLHPEASDVFVKYSIGQGYYCKPSFTDCISEADLMELKNMMLAMVEEDIPFHKYTMQTEEAMEMFRREGMRNKERLLFYRGSSTIHMYELDGLADYFYGYMMPSTGMLTCFDLVKYEDGFILQFPGANPKQVAEFAPADKFFQVLRKSDEWSEMMRIPSVGALNDAVADGRAREIILTQEALMEEQIGQLARDIVSDSKRKFVMIAGPSSSGKTTFANRLSTQLRALGMQPHPISLDDYYLDREFMPLDEFGQKDFESIEGLNISQFNTDMEALLCGERVELPTFNFKTGKSEYRGNFMQLGQGDILIIEGIHGLNPRMSEKLPNECKYKIYISALTQLSIDEHNPLATTDGRLLRRIVRDARTRGTSAQETIAMWDSVRRGEEKNIFPFQEEADAMFNSALIYETAVLKIYALPQLYAIPRDAAEYVEAKRLIKLLDYFLPIPGDDIANSSLIREFIGGGCFGL